MKIEGYFNELGKRVDETYAVAREAREKGLDPKRHVEIPIAKSLAERVVGLISNLYPQIRNNEIIEFIMKLEMEYGKLDPAICLKIAEEVAMEKFCKFENKLQAIEAGIRIGIAYLTLGVVSSPIEGFTGLKIVKRRDGKEYFSPYYSGPIRSAGGTGAAFSLVIVDHLREIMGYSKYDPDSQEIKRNVTEVLDYHERITNLQYLPSEEEIIFLASHLPVQINGEPSEEREVSNYKDLKRIETNLIRGGFCLVFAEGISQKAPKVWNMIRKLRARGFKLSGWDFLEEFVLFQKKLKESKKESGTVSAVYIQDIVAGRPVLGHPTRSGGFRLRYGRGRGSGYSALSIHPATMFLLDSFIAVGGQLKTEKPTKGAAISVCDTIDGPIVKLRDKSVRYIRDVEIAKKIYKDVEEILYLGDILVPYGDFANRNHVLLKPGFVKEWWYQELIEAGFKEEINYQNINIDDAISFSERYNVSLHPSYIFYWREISYEDFIALIDWMSHGVINKKILLPYNKTERERFQRGKRALELLGAEHNLSLEHVMIEGKTAEAFLVNLGLDKNLLERENFLMDNLFTNISKLEKKDVLLLINETSKYEIRDKSGTFIGARMGRPEKAKLRKLVGSPHTLFPVGIEGGRLRSVQESMEAGFVKADFPLYYCDNCKKETIYSVCEDCSNETKEMYYCRECRQKLFSKCLQHNLGQRYMSMRIDSRHYFNSAVKKLGLYDAEIPVLVKGVRGTSSAHHATENLAKGILRAHFSLNVNKDGTIRYDATELPLTHFKPREIGTSVEKLKEMGYDTDIYGKELVNDNQILEILPHDVVLPACPESLDERADDVFIRIAKFVDELLKRFYATKSFYNISKREDLIGHLVACIAPHNCASVVGRIIGFSKTQGLLASPYMHAAMRRDCVYPKTKLLFFDSNNDLHYPEIGSFVEKLIQKGCKTKIIDGVGTLSIQPDKEYFTYGADPVTKDMVKKKIKYFIKGPLDKQWIKITTSTNRELIMTLNHDFMHLNSENNIEFKKARDIAIGDKVLIMDHLNYQIKNPNNIDLIKSFIEKLPEDVKPKIRIVNCREFFKSLVARIGKPSLSEILNFNKTAMRNLHDWYSAVPLNHIESLILHKKLKYDDIPKQAGVRYWFSNYTFPRFVDINQSLCRLLGYYTAEGHCRENKTTRQVSFRICNNELVNKLLECIENSFSIKPAIEENNTKITISHAILYYLFKYVFDAGVNAKNKKIPQIIYSMSDDLVLDYISGYTDGDGSIIPERGAIVFYSASRSLLDDFALLLSRFHIIGRYQTTRERLPGKRLIERYHALGLEPRKFGLYHLVFNGKDCMHLASLLKLSHSRKLNKRDEILSLKVESRILKLNGRYIPLHSFGDSFIDYIKKVEFIEDVAHSYCVEVDWNKKEERSVVWGEQIINTRCDGDEAAVMLLLEMLLDFSMEFIPAHKGGTQDCPLVLNSRISAGEVDDMIFDFDIGKRIPLRLYRAACEGKMPYEVKLEQIKDRIGKEEFSNLWFTHDTESIDSGVLFSNYKRLPTMQEKVKSQMELVSKIRAVDTTDVARLIIERHFIRDIRGNLRKFSLQQFRCVKCNEKYRRPPLAGNCKCGGRLIFTISEGSIIKYLEPAILLAENYNVPAYVKQSLDLTKGYIESIFGRAKEKQEGLGKWI
ncbi:DNA polymerase II large subunit [Candidatus Pacearchaeota archaeon]|nr:DNA polymerase II large subunit [Candidatus Pacearchaeota archaeon]